MKDILFLDIEKPRNGSTDYGALKNATEFHENNPTELGIWILKSEIICGHNVIKHDVPELSNILGKEVFNGKRYVDTLLWSPLIFSENPYHKLVKGYKIVNESEANNPLSDCKLTKQLLLEEIESFSKFDENIKKIYFGLLKDQSAFNEFFKLSSTFYEDVDIHQEIKSLLKDNACNSVNFHSYIEESPVELAYVIAVLRLKSKESILPSWVSNEYPQTNSILEEIRFNSCQNETCKYCSTQLDLKSALQRYFNYPGFRKFDINRKISLQEETVRAGIQSQSFVAIFPTGGGKSLTFQLPALMQGESTHRLTVIISPLVSLMKDQVDNLVERFNITKAVAINGLLSPLERKDAIDRIRNGNAHILYISPESLRSPSIYKLITSRTIARFVIDEAHCFSSWGQDFRVDYLYIGEFIKKIQEEKKVKSIPVSCFTATAKRQVVQDIKEYFKDKLDLDLKEFVTHKGRSNLSYEVIQVKESRRKMDYLLPLLDDCEKPAIIYASRTKRVEEVCGLIEKAGFSCTFFHGQLDKDKKKEQMDLFMNGHKEIIVATSAFGMGVDKDNVKTVIHFNISDSLENYFQEAGRAGRKESIQAKCYILFNESDLNKHFSLLQQTKINKKEIDEIWRALKSQTKNPSNVSQSALEIAKRAGWDTEIRELQTRVTTAISALESEGFLKRVQNSPRIFANSLMVPGYQKGVEIILKAPLSEKEKKECERVLKRIITDEETQIDFIADRTELGIKTVQNAIINLRSLKILGDAKDLSAFINLHKSKNGSRQILAKYLKQEKALFKVIQSKSKLSISLRQLNQNIIDEGAEDSEIDGIKRLLTYWEMRGFISKHRTDREKDIYKILIKNSENLKEDILWRHSLSGATLDILVKFCQEKNPNVNQKKDVLAKFSLLELRDANTLMGTVAEENTKRYELSLLFLNQINAIKLEGGFMVSYNKLNIENIKAKEKPRYLNSDYEKLNTYYEQRTQQIHIVGEYAKKCIKDYESAISYANDYFVLEYEDFLAKYFPNRKSEIKRPLTKGKFEELIGKLDITQTTIVKDNKSEHILVLAGPGSGKTKVLVHKIASLLLLEDIKPEQFLMLTFSKAASLEFKSRMRNLVPEFSRLVKITTFHGFCFELLGQLGDLSKSKDVISDCLNLLESGELDSTMIQNKSVLVLDEFQDVSLEEWKLIQTIIKVAGNIRVVAVGDDDQNIYGFRNSSNAYMKSFKDEFKAVSYTLLKNYRSRAEIISFNNKFLKTISGRLKTDDIVPAKKTKPAKLSLVNYKGKKHLIEPLARNIAAFEGNGSKAVLVKTNKEALLLNAQLKELGKRTRLLAGFEGFKLNLLAEVRWFTLLLKKKTNEAGLIVEEDWLNALDAFREGFKFNKHYKSCSDVFRKFDKAYPKSKLYLDWISYIQEINLEDAIYADPEYILISTMHKAKGREFDHVWILAEDFSFGTNEDKRLMYVACSRAKESLSIHTNVEFLVKQIIPEFQHEIYTQETHPPKHIDIILDHKDINLNSFKFTKRVSSQLKTGDPLEKHMKKFGDNEAPGLATVKKENVLLFSKSFVNSVLNEKEKDGYALVEANVEYLVYWYNPDDEKEYRIVLPKVRFEKISNEKN